jgi:hypothetical protein
MRIVPGPAQGFANETTTANHMLTYAINKPEYLSTIATLFRKEYSPFTSLLADRKQVLGNSVFAKAGDAKGYRRVGSREIRWIIKGQKNRLGQIMKDYVCEAYPNEPGKNQTNVEVYVDTNWFSPRDVCELSDNETQIYFWTDELPEEVETGIWKYNAKVNTNVKEHFINPDLLKAGQDISVLFNQFEEGSETAYEKYSFHEEARTFMTIMRLKWSITGTAEAMDSNSTIWVSHNGSMQWTTKQEMEMLERWAAYRENQSLFGKSTVGLDGKTLMKLANGVDVMAGDGLLNQGDGVWRMPYNPNTFSPRILDTIMMNMHISSSFDNGDKAVAVIGGWAAMNSFNDIMKQYGGSDPKVVVEMGNGKKAINADYQYYEKNGVRFYPIYHKWFDDPERAGRGNVDQYGMRLQSHRMIFISLGDMEYGSPQIELLALGDRQMKKGSVNGINKGGDMANSVDASHHHILSETAIANRDINGIAELFVPTINKSAFYVNKISN